MSTLFLCLKIFFARLIDVSLGTIRTVFTVKDKHLIAGIIGLGEVIIWFLVVQEALMATSNNFWIAFSYSIGFAVGTYIGGRISNRLINSKLGLQVILSKKDDNVLKKIRQAGYAISVINVLGEEEKYMLYIQIDSKRYNHLLHLLNKLDKDAFIVVTETKVVVNGYFKVIK